MTDSDKGLFTRFEQRKREVAIEQIVDEQNQIAETNQQELNQLEDKDMPPLASLTEDSDYSMFLSDKVSPQLQKQALHKLFLSPGINVLDGLNDYDEDYTSFAALGNIVPYDLQQEIKREAEKIKQQLLTAEDPNHEELANENQTIESNESAEAIPATKPPTST